MGYWPQPEKPVVKQAVVTTSETTTSTSYTDLTTPGPAVTVDVPASGRVEVEIAADIANSTTNLSLMSVAVSGANTIAANNDWSLVNAGTLRQRSSVSHLFTGLTPGSTTFTAKYFVSDATGTFLRRALIVRTIP